MSYTAPLKEMFFVLNELAGLSEINSLPGCEEATSELVSAILEESNKFCSEVLAPLNVTGDQNPSYWKDGQVFTTKGFKESFRAFCESGWQGVQHPVEFGGQGLPKLAATACMEMLHAANLSFALCPLLTDAAIEALITAGSQVQKDTYIAKLISGQWTGTMNLTEPQAGSDLAAVRTRATKEANGNYLISGTKCFITYGEHDMVENIIHLVLARTPNAPEGVKGISLFIVPKFLVNSDGSLGVENDVHCVSIEHKLGIKASPTAVLQFGDAGRCTGYLIGEENRGLEYMFIMMNAARFGVGMQGVAIADRAYQLARNFSKERIQSRDLDGSKGAVSIIHHPDVRRMLMSMKSQVEAARALAYFAAGLSDIAHHSSDTDKCADAQARYEYLVPIVKGWSTEMSLDVTSTCVQIHGGMGFIEETGAAQHYRDARILPIYEGTSAIQANDLVGRKTLRDGGSIAKYFVRKIEETVTALSTVAGENASALVAVAKQLQNASAAYERTVAYVIANAKSQPKTVYVGSVLYLKQAGILLGGWQLARAALVANERLNIKTGDTSFMQAKIATAQFFAAQFLPQCAALEIAVQSGGIGALQISEDQF